MPHYDINSKFYVRLEGELQGEAYSAEFPTSTMLHMHFGANMNRHFYHWVEDSMKHGTTARGSMVCTDLHGNVTAWDDWHGGRVHEIQFPACDRDSPSTSTVALTLHLESVEQKAESVGSSYDGFRSGREALLIREFSVAIEGLPDTRYARKIEHMTFGAAGTGNTSSPDLTLSLREAHAAGFREWMKTRMTHQKGSVRYLTSDMESLHFDVCFHGLSLESIFPPVPLTPEAMVTVKLRSTGFDFNVD